jgi:hypothetical protein
VQNGEEKIEFEKSKTHLRLFKFDLAAKTEYPILDYVIDEPKHYLSPFFGKAFGNQFLVYTEKKNYAPDQEVFSDKG